MNKLLQRLTESATDAADLARRLTESGVRHVETAVKGLGIFRSLTALSEDDVEHDETHYLLVPVPAADRRYSVFSKRVIPSGHGETNSLPKRRIFHIPDPAALADLETSLVEQSIHDSADPASAESDLADRLEAFADEIDRQTFKVSGGLLLIGGAVAFVNPVVGAGIAAKALLPSISTKATKFGASLIGDKLRAWNRSRSSDKARKQAVAEVSRLKPTVFTNPLLKGLDAALTNPAPAYDPALDPDTWVDRFERLHDYTVTTEAVADIYRPVLSATPCPLDPGTRRWLAGLVGSEA